MIGFRGDCFLWYTHFLQYIARTRSPLNPENPIDSTLLALVRRFSESEYCWFSSVRPDGRAHSTPIWHVWHRGRVYVVTAPKAVKIANIQANSGVVVSHPDPLNPIIIEGTAALVQPMQAELRPLFKAKFDWDIAADSEYNTIIEVTPTKLLAWGQYGEGRWSGEAVQAVES